MAMMVRGVRGATTVKNNDADEILAATKELLAAIVEANGIEEEQVASVLFTTSPDLTAVYPAQAARDFGWRRVALMGSQEADIAGGLDHCIRILIHWNTERSLDEVQHFYLNDAVRLRPDLYPTNKIVLNGGNEQ